MSHAEVHAAPETKQAHGEEAKGAFADVSVRRLLLAGGLLLALLAVGFEGLARYAEYRARARVSAALGYATLVKTGISIHNKIHRELPGSLVDLDLPSPHEERYLAEVAWHHEPPLRGELNLYFGAVGGGVRPGDLLIYRARIDQYGRVRWRCDTTIGEGLLPPRYRPLNCLE